MMKMHNSMRSLSKQIRIKEALEDNLYWKLDNWFKNYIDGNYNFIYVVTQCRQSKPNKDTIKFMLDTINFDIVKFIDYIMDNVDGSLEIDDYPYIMQKTIDTIIANKTNDYNTEEN